MNGENTNTKDGAFLYLMCPYFKLMSLVAGAVVIPHQEMKGMQYCGQSVVLYEALASGVVSFHRSLDLICVPCWPYHLEMMPDILSPTGISPLISSEF